MTPEPGKQPLVCTSCKAAVEICEMCERDDCADALCFRCTIVEVRQEIPLLHPHGG